MAIHHLHLGTLGAVLDADSVKVANSGIIAGSLLTASLLFFAASPALRAQDITIPERRAPRWLEVSELSGEVTFGSTTTESLRVQLRQRLENAGDHLSTGSGASAILSFDTEIGQIRLSDNTTVEITTLTTTPTGGQVTRLAVPQGTASLQIRRFNNSTSALEIETPAGVAAVRGTEFGVGISGSGKTAVATNDGAVATTAAGETVLVSRGFYTTVIPGEPPAPPRSLADSNLWLELEPLRASEAGITISGRIFPANSLTVNGLSLEIEAAGTFSDTVPNTGQSVQLTVQSPLGQQAQYAIPLAIDGWQLYQESNYREAEAAFNDRLRLNPRDWDARLGLGYAAYAQSNLEAAQAAFESVQTALPDSVAALAGLGLVAAAKDDRETARNLWQAALERDPSNTVIQGYLEAP